MTGADTQLDLVTGASSYSGSHIAEGLLDAGRRVRTLTFHPDRPHPLRGRVEVLPYRFDDQAALTKNLRGVDTLYNTYWVRFDRGATTFTNAIANSRALFCGACRSLRFRVTGATRFSRCTSMILHGSACNPPASTATRSTMLLVRRR